MSFYATRFIYNGIPSEQYSLTITSDSPETSNEFGGDIRLLSDKLFRKTQEYVYGVSVEPMLSLSFKVITDNNELSALDASAIGRWLFGQNQVGTLQIVQPDMQYLFLYGYFLQPKIYRVGNIIRGFECTFHSIYPWAFTTEKTFTYNFSNPSIFFPVTHINETDNVAGYTYPKLIIETDIFGGDILISNESDNHRIFQFIGLSANETLTIDNNLQIITSSLGVNRLSKFNKKFFRLLPGVNNLLVSGAFKTLNIIYPLAKKIGG